MSKERMKGERDLIVDGQHWGWVGSKGGVLMISPARRKHFVDTCTFTGWTWHNIERAYHKGYAHALEISPRTVANYIRRHLIGKPFKACAEPSTWGGWALSQPKPIVELPVAWQPALH